MGNFTHFKNRQRRRAVLFSLPSKLRRIGLSIKNRLLTPPLRGRGMQRRRDSRPELYPDHYPADLRVQRRTKRPRS